MFIPPTIIEAYLIYTYRSYMDGSLIESQSDVMEHHLALQLLCRETWDTVDNDLVYIKIVFI